MGQIVDKSDTSNGINAKSQSQNFAPSFNNQRVHYSLNLGTSYIGGLGTFTTIAPDINYQLTPKLNMEVGGMFVSGYGNFSQIGAVGNGSQSSIIHSTNQSLIYAKGQYYLSNRLTITGSLFKTMNNAASQQVNPYFMDYKGMNIGLDYKISQHMSFGAQFNMSNGNNLFNQNRVGIFSPYSQYMNGM
jgi:hypothetical protein